MKPPGGAAASSGDGTLAVVTAADPATRLKRANEQGGLEKLLQDSYEGVPFDADTKAALNEQARKAREELAAKKFKTGEEEL